MAARPLIMNSGMNALVNARPAAAIMTVRKPKRKAMIPNPAIPTSPAVRETALLTPDATPVRFVPTAAMAVSGTMLTAMPSPKVATAGKNPVQ